MISVLLPSRGRPEALERSIASLRDLAEDPSSLEFLAAIDPDQEGMYAGLDGIRLWTAPERYGYARLHEYMNSLASLASGEWLMTWNDDALMLTAGWDAVVHAQAPGVLWPAVNHHPANNTFPVWPAAWTRLTGRVSLCFNFDSWIQETGEMAGRQWRIPVEIFHDRHNQTGSGRFDDLTAAEGTLLADSSCSVLRSPEMVAERQRDAALIRATL